ncbi:MAG TPA: glutathionylspermidine synthase family protein, partial [Gemmatimonadaceae bacterium]
MERLKIEPRANWREAVESRGLKWHTGATPYWSEDAYYRFATEEIDRIERATNDLHASCLEAVQHVIDEHRYAELKIPEHAIPLIEKSWKEEPPSIYGRFDLAYDGQSPPIMLEYNADTPTSLLEASVIQWDWMEAVHQGADQFNAIHERLIDVWREMIPHLRRGNPLGPLVHFSSMDDIEDGITTAYLAETAVQAGVRAQLLPVSEIGWDPD